MGVKGKSMVCLREEGAIMNKPPPQRKRELAQWRRGRGKCIQIHAKAGHRTDSKGNVLGLAHLGPSMPC